MFGRDRDGRRAKNATRVADEIRATIVRLDEQRRVATQLAGRALVNQAEVSRACAEQMRSLSAAFGEAENAEVLARRAEKAAREDGDADLSAFTRTAGGLRAVQQALGEAADPLHELNRAAHENVEQARVVLARAHEIFDEQVRDQVRLLAALEAAERARIARRFRSS